MADEFADSRAALRGAYLDATGSLQAGPSVSFGHSHQGQKTGNGVRARHVLTALLLEFDSPLTHHGKQASAIRRELEWSAESHP